MKAVVFKTSDCEYFNQAINIFKSQGFTNLEIKEYLGLTEEEIVNKFIELQNQFDYVLTIPPLPPNITNKIEKKILNKEEV